MVSIKQFYFGPLREHCLLVYDGYGSAVVVDPGMTNAPEREAFASFVADNNLDLKAILLTHAHFDHFYSVAWTVREYNAPVYLHPLDKPMIGPSSADARTYGLEPADTGFVTVDIHEGDHLKFGNLNFEVMHTPGHSPGGVCYYDRSDGKLFSGDTLFAGTIGRTDFAGGNYDDEIVSIMEKIMVLDGDTAVYPGHGLCTSISYERTHNPFLEPFNEKDPETGAVDGITIEER